MWAVYSIFVSAGAIEDQFFGVAGYVVPEDSHA